MGRFYGYVEFCKHTSNYLALNSEISIADPTALEERVAEANLVFGLNSYRELCGLHFGGITMTSSQLLLKCANRGARQAKHIVNMVKEALKRDEEGRANGTPASFTECVRLNKITSLAQNRLTLKLKRFRLDKCTKAGNSDDDSGEDDDGTGSVKQEMDELVQMDDKSAALVPREPKWVPESDFEPDVEEEDEEEVEDVPMPPKITTPVKSKKKKNKKNKAKVEGKFDPHRLWLCLTIICISVMDEGSEEEETVVLSSDQMQ